MFFKCHDYTGFNRYDRGVETRINVNHIVEARMGQATDCLGSDSRGGVKYDVDHPYPALYITMVTDRGAPSPGICLKDPAEIEALNNLLDSLVNLNDISVEIQE